MFYFESQTPLIKIYAAGGEVVRWFSLDGKLGWFATSNERTANELRKCIEKGIGGKIKEITKEQYDEYEKKGRGRSPFTPQREVINPWQQAPATSSVPGNRAAVAEVADEVYDDGGAAPKAEIESVVTDDPSPTLRKRGRPKK